jgi:uncharacterized Zn-finger protein
MNSRDSKFVTQPTLVQHRKAIVDDIPRRLVSYGHDRVSAVCDYTGLDTSWAPGPFRISFEAIYPFAVIDDQILYHAQPNTGYILSVINWLKRNHPILVLPLLGLYLRTHQEPDFQVRKVTWTSTYTALLNVTIMNRVLHCGSTHTAQIDQWEKWSLEKRSAVLDHLRTGAFGPVIQDELDGWTVGRLFMQSTQTFILVGPTTPGYWKKVYQWLIRIAQKHGLSRDEFEYYATVSEPNSPGGRVFFPFHVLAKAQAEGMAWDWCTIFGFAQTMLRRLRKQCNKHAEEAGFGEQEMDPLRLIYWWCHHLCKKIQRVKSERPSGTPEEIAFYLLDRWGLPVVPWTTNVLKASLCRKQDHGIAMRFGLCLPGNGEDFDPVEHWDDFLCTVTIDSQATNMAMRDFPVASWDSIRDALSRVPCSHPFWRMDADLGLRCWVSDWDEPLATQPLPIPVPALPLAPIDHWLGLAESPHFYGCTECPGMVSFPTAGLLLRHYQDRHWGGSTTVGPTDAVQDAIDEAYWGGKRERLRCNEPGCGKVFSTAAYLRKHKEMLHAETKPQFRCMQLGCDKVYSSPDTLRLHVKDSHSEAPPSVFPCTEPGCGKSFASSGNLRIHLKRHTAGPKGFPCLEPGCGKAYSNLTTLRAHAKAKHSVTPPPILFCVEPGCGRSYTSAYGLRIHVGQHHTATPPTFPCKEPGCGKVFSRATNLASHVTSIHRTVRLYHCDAPNCGQAFSDRIHLRAHTLTQHSAPGILSFACPEPGCGRVYTDNSNLRRHTRDNHSTVMSYHCDAPNCGESFSSIYNLRRHAKTHRTVAPSFVCPEPGCGMVYTSPYSFNKHMEDDHTLYHCNAPNCDQTFSDRSDLRAHTRVQHSAPGTQFFTCPVPGCGKSYNRQPNLRAHIKTRHPERAAS